MIHNSQENSLAARLRDRRHLLILLGLICQGFASASLLLVGVYAGVWLLCLSMHSANRRFSKIGETVVVATALIGAYAWGQRFSFNPLIFVGNGLVLFQALYLLRPLDVREKSYMVSVAVVHVATATMVVVDWPFLLVLAVLAALLPAALRDIAATQMGQTGGSDSLRWRRDLPLLGAFMLGFFLLFPRLTLLRSGGGSYGQGPLRPELDMAATAAAGSQTLIMQISGDQLDYLKTLTLDTLGDDGRWRANRWLFQPLRRLPRDSDAATAALPRHVRIVSPLLLTRLLPADGTVVSLAGPFPRPPVLTNGGTVLLPERLRRPVSYEYSRAVERLDLPLPAEVRQLLLRLPPLSPQVRAWHRDTVASAATAYTRALRLRDRLKTELRYELGAPELDRTATLEDFLLHQKRGHCERFAAALALLLRLDGTPARLAVGYVAMEKNELGNFYNVRASHAHAWTEAWFPDRGWVVLDATPNATRTTALVTPPLTSSLQQWLSYVWFGAIVEFGSTQQTTVFRGLGQLAITTARLLMAVAPYLLGAIGLGLLSMAAVAWRRWRGTTSGRAAPTAASRDQTLVRGFYGSLLAELAQRGYRRQPAQTPMEFCTQLQHLAAWEAGPAQVVTELFCRVRYRGSIPNAAELAAVQAALAKLRQPRH